MTGCEENHSLTIFFNIEYFSHARSLSLAALPSHSGPFLPSYRIASYQILSWKKVESVNTFYIMSTDVKKKKKEKKQQMPGHEYSSLCWACTEQPIHIM